MAEKQSKLVKWMTPTEAAEWARKVKRGGKKMDWFGGAAIWRNDTLEVFFGIRKSNRVFVTVKPLS